MAYINSNANRFYTALEASYGQIGAVTASNRIPALKLTVQQQLEMKDRKDKTGSRTFAGLPAGGRRRTSFELRTYLTNLQSSGSPAYGPLVQAALGGTPLSFAGGTVSSSTTGGRLGFAAPHGLSAGQAVASGSEVRFVSAIVDPSDVQLNAPFTVVPSAANAAVTYVPATNLPSATIFDYWSPSTAVQRVLCGAGVDQMHILLNGDYHELHFSGLAQDVIDSSSFSNASVGQLSSFPAEPALGAFNFSVVPGNLGQAWLGTSPNQFFTITSAQVTLKNSLEMRAKEFGSSFPRALSPGQRSVTATFDLFSQDDNQTVGLYQAARQRSPISLMLQLGDQAGQMMAVYLSSMIPEVPEFDDGDNQLQWKFRPSRAQGTIDNEIAVAFA